MPLDGGTLDLITPEALAPLLEPKRFKGAWGGRGGAKSHFFGESLIERCLMNEGTRWVCVREHMISLTFSVKQLLEDKIRSMGVSRYFGPQKTLIETPGGGVIIFQGMKNHTADSIKSLEGFDGAWVEEAQSLSQRSLDLLRPTIRKPGSEIWFSWNPDQANDPVDAFLRKGFDAKLMTVCKSLYTDNPFFPDVLREDMEYDKRRDLDRYNHIWLGGYNTKSDARVFRNWRVGDPEEIAKARKDASRFYYGADWGFSVDPSVLIEVFIVGRTMYISNEAYSIGCEIDHTPFLFGGCGDPKLREINRQAWNSLSDDRKRDWKGIKGAREWPCTADSARPDTIAYMRKHGFDKIKPARKGPNSIEDGIEFMKSYDIVVAPHCVHTIDELTMYAFEVDDKTMEILPKLADKNNHVIDACRYAIEPLRRGRIGVHA